MKTLQLVVTLRMQTLPKLPGESFGAPGFDRFKEGAQGLCFATFGPSGTCGIVPRLHVDMSPSGVFGYETFEKKGGNDRPRHWFAGHAVNVGDRAVDPTFVSVE